MVRVNIEVPAEKREEWHEFADSHEDYSSLTHLISIAVRKEIKEKNGELSRGRARGSSGAVQVQTQGIERQMERMQETIADLSDSVRDIKLSQQSDGMSKEHIKELMHEAIGYLPALGPEQTLEDLMNIHERDHAARARRSGTVEDIASALGADTWDVEVALSRAVRDIPHVQAERVDGVRRYYQEE